MPDPDTQPVLRRKIGAPASPFDQDGISPAKALRIAIARAGEAAAELEVAIAGFSETKVNLEEIAKILEEPHMIFKIISPVAGIGLALWDTQSVSAFLEQLITGRVVPSAAEKREPTPTDAAILSSVFNSIMSGFDAELGQIAGLPPVQGYRYAGTFDDGRAVSMALDDVAYRQYQVSLDLGNSAKKGMLHLIFPWEKASTGSANSGGKQWSNRWHDAVQDAEAPVLAILHRLAKPLSEIAQFEIGTTIAIPTEAIGMVSLEGQDHRAVAAGRLGQSNGHRAVRISLAAAATPDEAAIPFQKAQPSNGNASTGPPAEIPVAQPTENPTDSAGQAVVSID